MKNKNLKRDIKQYLEENQVDIFLIKELRKEFAGIGQSDFKKGLRDIIDLEYTKIENGKYCKNTFRNEYVIGGYLTTDAVIAYWSALNIHGLTEQFPNKVFIQTTKKKQDTEIFGVSYKFVKVRPDKLTGIVNFGVGSHQFRITDIEKTIIDCFDLIGYSGGSMELIRALNRAELDANKLIEYSERVNNKSIVKRIGYLAELFNKKKIRRFIKYAKSKKGKNYDLLDVVGPNEGKYNAEWRLRLNVKTEDILYIANSIY